MAAGCGMVQVASKVRKRRYSRRLGSARYPQIPAALPGAAGKRRQGAVSSDRTPVALRVAQDLRRNTAAPRPSLRGNTVRMQCWWMWSRPPRPLRPPLPLSRCGLSSLCGGAQLHDGPIRSQPLPCRFDSVRAVAGAVEYAEDVLPLVLGDRGVARRSAHGRRIMEDDRPQLLHLACWC
jgi:hypothetical protein